MYVCLGDPTFFGNLLPSQTQTEIMVDAVRSNKYNGYLPAAGQENARRAIAEYTNLSTPDEKIEPSVSTYHDI